MASDEEAELRAAVDAVLASRSPKKLVVAGPGAGKTTLFKRLLEQSGKPHDKHLVLTFNRFLKNDLESNLSDLAVVSTLHGYCQELLRRNETLRHGLTQNFRCYPGLLSIIKRDWEWITRNEAPTFVDRMRALDLPGAQLQFYYGHSNYYDAVDFDDSVYRVTDALAQNPGQIPAFELILIDEFQDFNKMEARVIEQLAGPNSIVIAGDDDQALYSGFRAASPEFIRALHSQDDIETHFLPFCMRCTEVIVEALGDLVRQAQTRSKLAGRIDKPYRFFPPAKGADSKEFPKIVYVTSSVQSRRSNYFGRYIEQSIREIPNENAVRAEESREPLALIIGNKPYTTQVSEHLKTAGLISELVVEPTNKRIEALAILKENPQSNLAWRILLEEQDEGIAIEAVRRAFAEKLPLVDVVPNDLRDAILEEAADIVINPPKVEEPEPYNPIQITTYEGSKGRSAQYVFIVGPHKNELPRNIQNMRDIEICKFLVGLTRTRKKCTILVTKRFANQPRLPSVFLSWIERERFESIIVNAKYWKK